MQNFSEIKILNTKFHKLTVQELISYMVESGQIDKKTIVANVNVRAINFACDLPWYQKFINDANVVFCDGVGVIIGAKILGYDLESIHRMTCPDYIESLALACEQKNVSLFLLASKVSVRYFFWQTCKVLE